MKAVAVSYSKDEIHVTAVDGDEARVMHTKDEAKAKSFYSSRVAEGYEQITFAQMEEELKRECGR